MAERNDPPRGERLPIKLILPKQGKEKKVSGGGSPPKPFRQVSASYRKSLGRQVAAIRDATLGQMKEAGAAPVRVKVLPRSVAKSHRPETLFTANTCPIVGVGRLDELFIKATADGLARLTRLIESGDSAPLIKELSCIETIEAVTPGYRRKGLESADVLRRSPRGEQGFITRVRLFNLGADEDQLRLVAQFRKTCDRRGIEISRAGYAPNSFTYSAECRSVDDVEVLSKLVAVRAIVSMPLIRTLRPKMFNAKALPTLPKRTDVAGDVPVVVVVDSGIGDQLPDLESWVVGRDSQVAPPYRNSDHGTFVAGLICWGAELNPNVAGIDPGPCAVFDLQVIPNDDPSKGDTEVIREQELLVSLETALQQHSNEFKVWNLSLGTDTVCSLDEFSEFAEELDNLQEKYQVSFVISAGNFAPPPLLTYPRKTAQLELGRITTPADSVLGIAVGSVSHVDYKKNGPKQHEPSAFSRHGAGPN
jgi:serine protease AprX